MVNGWGGNTINVPPGFTSTEGILITAWIWRNDHSLTGERSQTLIWGKHIAYREYHSNWSNWIVLDFTTQIIPITNDMLADGANATFSNATCYIQKNNNHIAINIEATNVTLNDNSKLIQIPSEKYNINRFVFAPAIIDGVSTYCFIDTSGALRVQASEKNFSKIVLNIQYDTF